MATAPSIPIGTVEYFNPRGEKDAFCSDFRKPQNKQISN